jgi:hypothetical protein
MGYAVLFLGSSLLRGHVTNDEDQSYLGQRWVVGLELYHRYFGLLRRMELLPFSLYSFLFSTTLVPGRSDPLFPNTVRARRLYTVLY